MLPGSGVRDTATVLGISVNCVLRTLVAAAKPLTIRPQQSHYYRVQIDELWSYVSRKKKKVWLLYAYYYYMESRDIVSFALGKRDVKAVKNLMLKLKGLEIDFYCIDK